MRKFWHNGKEKVDKAPWTRQIQGRIYKQKDPPRKTRGTFYHMFNLNRDFNMIGLNSIQEKP